MHLCEFKIGVLKYDWDDPHVADFQNNLDRVYAVAERSPGYVWHMPPDAMEEAQLDPQGILGANPRTASTLSVWETPEALYAFTFETVHKQFFDRRGEWYDPEVQPTRFVMWWVEEGQRPTVEQAAERLETLTRHGDTEAAFGWKFLSGMNR